MREVNRVEGHQPHSPEPGYRCDIEATRASLRALEVARIAGQRRLHSFLESVVNILVGMGVAMLSNAVLFPLFGWHISGRQNLALGAIYTGISLVRSFVLRRLFNRWHVTIATRGNQ